MELKLPLGGKFYRLVEQIHKQVVFIFNKINAYDRNLRYACGHILLPSFHHRKSYVLLNIFRHAYGRMKPYHHRISYLLHAC